MSKKQRRRPKLTRTQFNVILGLHVFDSRKTWKCDEVRKNMAKRGYLDKHTLFITPKGFKAIKEFARFHNCQSKVRFY